MYFVYILSSRSRVLYIGITRDLENRLIWHRANANPKAFTARYHVHRLVYCEEYTEVTMAIAREKEMKGWARWKKVRLIESVNPEWEDLAAEAVPIPRPGPSLRSG